jgi:hypothetical protein
MKEMTGSIIVPAFVFTGRKLLFLKEKKVLIGFENNKQEIEYLVQTMV